MEAIPQPPGAEVEPGTACDLLAYAAVRVAPEGVPALRLKPGPGPGERLPAAFLKHADEQSVAGLAAVFQAIERHGLTATRFTDWGVLGAPRFIGRVAMAAAMHRFATEGAWGISPHLIPHRSLHALSGTISQALKVHGPNFGVGGGPEGATEALLMAAALLGTRPLPGLWVALTAWDPEPVPDEQGHPTTPGVCTALALALAPARPGWHGLRAHVGLARGNGSPAPRTAVPARPLTLEGLLAALTSADPCPAPAVWQVAQGGWLRLERVGGGLPAPHLFRPRSGIDGWREGSGAGPGRNA